LAVAEFHLFFIIVEYILYINSLVNSEKYKKYEKCEKHGELLIFTLFCISIIIET